MSRFLPLFAALFLALAAGLSMARSAAGAAEPVRIALLPAAAHGSPLHGPGYFVVHTRPGHHVHLYARVSNLGTAAITISLLPVDTKRAPDGNISYNLPGQPRRQVGAWARLPVKTLRLHSGQSRLVAFLLRVPTGARPGAYIGALTAYVPVPASSGKHGAVIEVQTRLAVAIVVTIQAAR